ncbi:MAG: helix-turn-helix transcriptional regulator [Panacagrimonas sp.]
MSTEVTLLRLPEVVRRTACSKSTIYQRERDGTFPKRLKVGPRTTAWRSDEIAAFIEARTAESRSAK